MCDTLEIIHLRRMCRLANELWQRAADQEKTYDAETGRGSVFSTAGN